MASDWSVYHSDEKRMTEGDSALFETGQLVTTPAFIEAAGDLWCLVAMEALKRHKHGDWGDLEEEDAAQNALAVNHGERIHSVYTEMIPEPVFESVTFWVITEADRSVTTILLPSDY